MSGEFDVEALLSKLMSSTAGYLAKKGCSELAMEREWIEIHDQRSDYLAVIVHIPISGKLQVPLLYYGKMGSFEADLDRAAQDLADALPNIQAGRTVLRKYIADVRRAAKTAVAEAKASGHNLVLKSVGFRNTRPSALRGNNWEYATEHLLATIHVRNLDAAKNDRDQHLIIEQPEDVAEEISELLEQPNDLD